MRTKITDTHVQIWLNKREVSDWCNRWPCSGFAGKSIWAEFDANGLIDVTFNSRYTNTMFDNVDGTGFSCCIADHLKEVLPVTHPAYFVTVGQFLEESV